MDNVELQALKDRVKIADKINNRLVDLNAAKETLIKNLGTMEQPRYDGEYYAVIIFPNGGGERGCPVQLIDRNGKIVPIRQLSCDAQLAADVYWKLLCGLGDLIKATEDEYAKA